MDPPDFINGATPVCPAGITNMPEDGQHGAPESRHFFAVLTLIEEFG